MKKYGIKYFFRDFIINKSNNSDKIISVFSKNWFLDDLKKDILEIDGISISNSINRRLSIKFTYILRAYFAIKFFLKNKSSLKISTNCNYHLLTVSKVFKKVEIINFKKKKENLFLDHSPDRARVVEPKTYNVAKIFRSIQKFLPKKNVLYFGDSTSFNSAIKNKQILIKNSKNIFKSFYFCKNDYLNHKYDKLISSKIRNYNEDIIYENIIKILNIFSINHASAKVISKIFLSLLNKELKIHKKIFVKSLSVYEDLFQFYKPENIIQNGESGFDNILISELSRLYDSKNFLLIDGYQFFVDEFIFFKNKENKLSFDKVFAYGTANQKIYLNQGFKKNQIIKINSPILDQRKKINSSNFKNPLIIGYQPNLNCYQTPFDIQIKIELDLIKLFQEMKFANLIIKLKDGDKILSGVGLKTPDFYKNLYENYFNTEMTIKLDVRTGSLVENFKNTSFIVGGFSTSIIESIQNKVPYFFYEPIENGYKKNVLKSVRLFDKNKIARDIFSLKKNIINKNFIPFKMQNLTYNKKLFHINFKNI